MNTRQKKTLYESIMKSVAKTVKKALNENIDPLEPYALQEILECEFPLEINSYTVTVSEYEVDDLYIYFHAEKENGYQVDFEIRAEELWEEYKTRTIDEIISNYLEDAIEDDEKENWSRGEIDELWDDDL